MRSCITSPRAMKTPICQPRDQSYHWLGCGRSSAYAILPRMREHTNTTVIATINGQNRQRRAGGVLRISASVDRKFLGFLVTAPSQDTGALQPPGVILRPLAPPPPRPAPIGAIKLPAALRAGVAGRATEIVKTVRATLKTVLPCSSPNRPNSDPSTEHNQEEGDRRPPSDPTLGRWRLYTEQTRQLMSKGTDNDECRKERNKR